MSTSLVEITWRDRQVHIECAWIDANEVERPLIVFLHEGLGSVSMWRDFPAQLCAAVGARGLVYSRPGYGLSTPRADEEAWRPDFMHQQAHEVLPALLRALGIDANPKSGKPSQSVYLLGHSDGGSIALLHAAHADAKLAGVITMAPHIMVEAISIQSIAAAREAYLHTDLRQRLARHHAQPDSAFWGWNNIWLHPDFRDWSIVDELATIECPLLAIQGVDDEYGTLEQVRGIARQVRHTQLVELPDCGHSPHRDQPAAVIKAVRDFVGAQGVG